MLKMNKKDFFNEMNLILSSNQMFNSVIFDYFGVWDWHVSDSEIGYSIKCLEMLGYITAYKNINCIEFIRCIFKEDQSIICKLLRNPKDNILVEIRIVCRDRIYKWFRIRGKVFEWDKEGNPLRIMGTFEDIDEEVKLRQKVKQEENRINGIYNALNMGIALGEIVVTKKGKPKDIRCLEMNDIMKSLFGNTPKITADWIEMFYEAGINRKSFEFETVGKDINKYYKVNIYSPNPLQFALLIIDISDDKKREQELLEKYDELQFAYKEISATNNKLKMNNSELETVKEEVNKAKKEFIDNMSHELITPLNGILGSTQILHMSDLSAEQNQTVQIIEKSSNHLLKILKDILHISNITNEKIEIVNHKFDFIELMDYWKQNMISLTKEKDIEIKIEIDSKIERILIGDRYRLNQILDHLIQNAVKFTESGYILLKVSQISNSNKETKLKFIIEDTGKGIHKDNTKDIFKEFVQEDLSYSKKYDGTGIGLTISKELVKLMGGKIGYYSKKESGSIFYFTVVLKKCIEHPKQKLKKSQKYKLKTVLVVDDNEINSKIITTFLEQYNCVCKCAWNGQEAVDYLENNKVDMIFMDIQMPILNGYQATRLIREREKLTKEHVIIIAHTAYAMEGDKEKFLSSGMDDYLPKPINHKKLSDIIQKYQN